MMDSTPNFKEFFTLHRAYATGDGDVNATPHLVPLEDFASRYALVRHLGGGEYGKVFVARLKIDNVKKTVVLKCAVTTKHAKRIADALSEAKLQHFLTRLFMGSGNELFNTAPFVKQYDHMLVQSSFRDMLKRCAEKPESLAQMQRALADEQSGEKTKKQQQGEAYKEPSDEQRANALEEFFKRVDGGVKAEAPVRRTRSTAPSSSSSSPPPALSIAVMERATSSFGEWILTDANYRKDKVGVLLVTQLLCALHMLYECVNFTHFDLHPFNVLLHKIPHTDDYKPLLRYSLAVDSTLFLDVLQCENYVVKLADFGHAHVDYNERESGLHFRRVVERPSSVDVDASEVYAYTHANPGFDMQRFALSTLGHIIAHQRTEDAQMKNGLALASIDIPLLRLLTNMLEVRAGEHPEFDYEQHDGWPRSAPNAQDEFPRTVQHPRLVQCLQQVIELRQTYLTSKPTLTYPEFADLEGEISELCVNLVRHAFYFDADVSPTPRNVLATNVFTAELLANPEYGKYKDRTVVDMSVHIGNAGSATLAALYKHGDDDDDDDDDDEDD
jgi:serine/threonine protein kinase